MRLALAVTAAALCLSSPSVRAQDAAPAPAPAAEAAPSGGDLVAVVVESGATFKGQIVGRDARTLHLRSPSGIVRDLPLQSVRSIVPWTDAHEAARTGPVAAPDDDAAAPGRAPQAGSRAGIGVALSSGSTEPILFFPIQLSDAFRIEPEVSLRWVSAGTSSVTAIGAGIGFFAVRPVIPQVRAYVGPRFSVAHVSGTHGVPADTAFGAAFAVGGEWAPVASFSLGAELDLGIARETQEKVSTASTDALLFVRFFL